MTAKFIFPYIFVHCSIEINYADGKEHLVAAFITNCKSRNARQAILKQLSKRISIHYFGPCNFGGVEQKCARGVPECFLRVAKSYKFIIAIENSNCKSYITEKFFFNAMRYVIKYNNGQAER